MYDLNEKNCKVTNVVFNAGDAFDEKEAHWLLTATNGNETYQLIIYQDETYDTKKFVNNIEEKLLENDSIHDRMLTHIKPILQAFNYFTSDDNVLNFSPELEQSPNTQSAGPQPNIVSAETFFSNDNLPNFPEYDIDYKERTNGNNWNDIVNIEIDAEMEQLKRQLLTEKSCPKPSMIFIKDLHQAAEKLAKKETDEKSARDETEEVGTYLLTGCDALTAPAFPALDHAVIQVASQFNGLESIKRDIVSPNRYKYDFSQGPGAQRASPGAALARFVHVDDCDFLSQILADKEVEAEFKVYFDYTSGYLTPRVGREPEALIFFTKHIDKLILNVERVKVANSENQNIQVLNSTLALGEYDLGYREINQQSIVNDLSELLLKAQYKAVASVAILEAKRNPTTRIPLLFTLIGGGVYGNDKRAIAIALNEAIKFIKNSEVTNIDICLSVYRHDEVWEYVNAVQFEPNCEEIIELLQKTPIPSETLQSLRVINESVQPAEDPYLPQTSESDDKNHEDSALNVDSSILSLNNEENPQDGDLMKKPPHEKNESLLGEPTPIAEVIQDEYDLLSMDVSELIKDNTDSSFNINSNFVSYYETTYGQHSENTSNKTPSFDNAEEDVKLTNENDNKSAAGDQPEYKNTPYNGPNYPSDDNSNDPGNKFPSTDESTQVDLGSKTTFLDTHVTGRTGNGTPVEPSADPSNKNSHQNVQQTSNLNLSAKSSSYQSNTHILTAMDKAISGLSKKSHLGTDQQKSLALSSLKNSYQKASTVVEANKVLIDFIKTAATPRKSSWGSLFTSAYGKTDSFKAFVNSLNRSENTDAHNCIKSVTGYQFRLDFSDSKQLDNFAAFLEKSNNPQDETSCCFCC